MLVVAVVAEGACCGSGVNHDDGSGGDGGDGDNGSDWDLILAEGQAGGIAGT